MFKMVSKSPNIQRVHFFTGMAQKVGNIWFTDISVLYIQNFAYLQVENFSLS